MIPQDQTRTGMPDGNCFAACIASILGMHIDDVDLGITGDDNWMMFVDSWLSRYGFGIVYSKTWPLRFRGHAIALGTSPRGIPHAVVWAKTGMVHDPHPSRLGLDGQPEGFIVIAVR